MDGHSLILACINGWFGSEDQEEEDDGVGKTNLAPLSHSLNHTHTFKHSAFCYKATLDSIQSWRKNLNSGEKVHVQELFGIHPRGGRDPRREEM